MGGQTGVSRNNEGFSTGSQLRERVHIIKEFDIEIIENI
jgi:hypothetical protein